MIQDVLFQFCPSFWPSFGTGLAQFWPGFKEFQLLNQVFVEEEKTQDSDLACFFEGENRSENKPPLKHHFWFLF